MQTKVSKYVKLNALKTAVSKFESFRFWPAFVSKIYFPKKNEILYEIFFLITNFKKENKTPWIKKLWFIKKTLHVLKLYSSNSRIKFRGNIFVFGCAMAKDRVKLIMLLSWDAIFGIYNCGTSV